MRGLPVPHTQQASTLGSFHSGKSIPEWMLEICQKVVDEESQAGIMGLNNTHHDTHAQLTHTIQR